MVGPNHLPTKVILFLGEQQQEGDQQGENAKRFCHGKTKDEAAELTVGSTWVTQRALQELTEKVANADGGSAGADSGKACTDELC